MRKKEPEGKLRKGSWITKLFPRIMEQTEKEKQMKKKTSPAPKKKATPKKAVKVKAKEKPVKKFVTKDK